MTTDQSLSRRGFLRASAGAASVASASGVGGGAEGGSGGGTTHTVDMTDGLKYKPDELTIAPGDTVTWKNVGNVPHTVTAYGDQIPPGATYFASGGFDSEQAAREDWNGPQKGAIPGGESYSHTFQTEGTYEYFCIPHETAGMKGSITVSSGGDGGSGGGPPAIPDSAKTIGVATTVAMLTTLALAFSFLKYGGGSPEE